MSAGNLPLDRDAMRLVAEIGFIGTQTGQLAASRALFESLLLLRPDSNLPFIGLAMVELAAQRPEKAVVILRDQGLKQHPDDAELMAFLGLALQTAGEVSQAQKVLAAVVSQEGGDAQPHVRMASKLLILDKGSISPTQLMPHWSGRAEPVERSPLVSQVRKPQIF
ncbi:M48 family metallopeptidase [Caenimonas sp. SL110]|uniref:tetratricopeptide repeat protein n=1 Tax=Caenimonas sp. SL110 TaxID=1450524 RepID=UPI000653EC7D|nr:tetratricopeptide repeat protein [Caenimonas sp. SL110]